MAQIKRIVAATDMSQFGSRAEARAAMLAHELGTESLDLLHIVDSLSLEALRQLVQAPEQVEHRLLESSRNQMAEIEKRLAEQYGISVATTTLNVGQAHTEIVRFATLLDAGLVVLGAHGGSFVRDLFVGSTVDKVLRKLACPLLIVKRKPQVPYRQVLIAVDFSPSSRQIVQSAMSIAPGAHFTVLHAFEVPFGAKLHSAGVDEQQIQIYRSKVQGQRETQMRQLVSEWSNRNSSLSSIVEFGSAPDVIREKVKMLGSDLVVIGKFGWSGAGEMLLGGVTKQVIQQSDCDVLVVGENSTAA